MVVLDAVRAEGVQTPVLEEDVDGAAEGSGVVRLYDDPVWSYPAIEDLVRISLVPVR